MSPATFLKFPGKIGTLTYRKLKNTDKSKLDYSEPGIYGRYVCTCAYIYIYIYVKYINLYSTHIVKEKLRWTELNR